MLTDLKKQIFEWVVIFMCGVSGSYVFNRKNKRVNWYRFVGDAASGGLCAAFITPWLSESMNLSMNGKFVIAFGIGAMGYRSMDILITIIEVLIKSKKQ